MCKNLEWKDFFCFYSEKSSTLTPITDSFVNDPTYDYQQKDKGYIQSALDFGIIQNKDRKERNKISQKWHFFVSYLWKEEFRCLNELKKMSQEEQVKAAIQSLSKNPEAIWDKKPQILPCPELTIWMAEVAGVFETDKFSKDDNKLLDKMIKAVKTKKREGLRASTIWSQVNTEVFNEQAFIWNRICEAVNKHKQA